MAKKFATKLVSIILTYSLPLISFANADNKQHPSGFLFIEKQIYKTVERNGLTKTNLSVNWSKSTSGDYVATIKCNKPQECNKPEVSIPFSKKDLMKNKGKTFLNANKAKQLQPLIKNTGNEGAQLQPLIDDEMER